MNNPRRENLRLFQLQEKYTLTQKANLESPKSFGAGSLKKSEYRKY